MSERILVSDKRGYAVRTVAAAKEIARSELSGWSPLASVVIFGLPEVDDRYHVWRVPLLAPAGSKVGEIVIDARTGAVQPDRTSAPDAVAARLAVAPHMAAPTAKRSRGPIPRSPLTNSVYLGDCRETLAGLPEQSIDLIFTSPPYFNARPDYSEYEAYADFLIFMDEVIRAGHRVLAEGRFFVLNVAPVLIRRASRSEASHRIAVPFDLHRLFTAPGEDGLPLFEFMEDIIWEKPEGAGWATNRGRRFSRDRNPLAYKTVPVTENVLVYRKRTDRLLDWNIRNHDPELVGRSKIADGYETTNIWRLPPAHDKVHPAPFPQELAERVIRYYSFIDDVVCDPFAGKGTVAEAALALDRRFLMCETEPTYLARMQELLTARLGATGCAQIDWHGLPGPAA